MNMLSLSAVLGILVLIFQDGRLQGLLSYTSQGALDATQPIFLAAVAFGLATDYGISCSRGSKRRATAAPRTADAVAIGLERTGRIVTAQRSCSRSRSEHSPRRSSSSSRNSGLGASLAVLIDASIIPGAAGAVADGTLGSWNWWAPKPLSRLHDRIGLRESGLREIPAPDPSALLTDQTLPRKEDHDDHDEYRSRARAQPHLRRRRRS